MSAAASQALIVARNIGGRDGIDEGLYFAPRLGEVSGHIEGQCWISLVDVGEGGEGVYPESIL